MNETFLVVAFFPHFNTVLDELYFNGCTFIH